MKKLVHTFLKLTLLVLLPVLQAAAQGRTVTGTVTAKEDGQALTGVSVVVKGTTTGTTTDTNGAFSIQVPPSGATLVFSFIGLLSQEVAVSNESTLNVQMAQDRKALDEVVVVGYGTQKKRDLTGAISSVKAEDLVVNSGAASIGHMLKGKAAGLMIRENSAQPGGGLDILIRGAGSINASNAPLIVVDGFPISDLQQPGSGGRYQAGTQSILNSFNPNDIESIEVLKDASATSIYGARAANGVILITTKRGKTGKAEVQYSNTFSIQKYNNPFDVLPLNEWMQVRNEAAWERWNFDNNVIPYGNRTLEEAQADPINGPFRRLYTQNAINNVGRGTDWIGLVTRDGSIQQHNLSLTGGTESTKFLLSGNYYKHNGVIKNSGIERFTVRANVDQDVNKYIKFGLNLTASRINNDNSQLGGDQFENSGIIRAAMQMGPHIKPIDENGNYPVNPLLALQPNPYSLLTISDEGRIERMLLNSFIDIIPIPDLTIRLKGGMDRGITKRWNYLPKTTIHGALEFGRASIAEIDKNEYLMEATASYVKTIATHHRINLLAGASQQNFYNDFTNVGNTNFISDAFLWNNLGAGSSTKTVGSSRSENVMASYFGRLNYTLKDRYLLTLTVRTDGASVFARNNKWGTFPSVAVGWNIAEEPFFGGLANTVSQFKLRASYGQTGNASIGSNAFAAYYAYPAWLSGNDTREIGVSLSRLENPDLKWETTTEANFGLDFSLFNGRIDGSLEVYNRVISDLLAFKPINSYHPINTIMANVGKTQSKGFELTVSTRNFQRNDFEWRSIFTFSRFKDTWKERAPDWKPAVYENVNDPIRAIYARVADGIMQVGEEVPSQPELRPGMIKIKDINGYQRDANGNPMVDENGRFLRTGAPDGIIDDADTRLIGTSDPSLIVGMTNIFTYKGFTLNFDFNGMFGRKMADPNYTTYGISADGIYTYGYNALRTVKNRWTPENPSTTQPSSFYGWSPYSVGDFFLQDAWFVRLQNVALAYTLPTKWTGKVFSRASIHVTAQNLFVITPYEGIDPETDAYTAAYPNVKTFTTGINLTF
ncbi:SusC/RagA family TonB-linked outer membrane protein [Rufibacter psychrotolerans]|uniref:SusC/RagA family TonB-linked outer membrane protein n=1 Tax=Rufibacter psychrotolerans TaxID=2812556 RepID=UPI001967CC4B|nr:TonB-dependent receptor [Rufibacter sp. SYSU D00308]